MTFKTILMACLAALFLIPGAVGFYFFQMIVLDWASKGFAESGAFAAVDTMLYLVSVTGITVSVFLLGLVLRAFKAVWARKVSLGLAAFETVVMILVLVILPTYHFVFLDMIPFAPVVLFILVVPGVIFGVLPAFFYWLRGTRDPASGHAA